MIAEECYVPTNDTVDLKGYIKSRTSTSYMQQRSGKVIEAGFTAAPSKLWGLSCQSTSIDSTIEQQFQNYLKLWKKETAGDSSLNRITGNMNYLRIMTMGKGVIPLILRELQREPAPWFVALRALSKDDSIGRDSPGDFRKIASAWIRWGKQQAYI